MTRLELLKSMSIDDFIKWVTELAPRGDAPWDVWFDTKYCKNCTPLRKRSPVLNRETEFAFCELRECCRYFPKSNVLSEEGLIKLWLESEAES